jgi:hypothetical protein
MEWGNNNVLDTLFTPEILTPEQYYDERRDDSAIYPVKRLMMAVLEDALRCFQNNATATSGPRLKLFEEAHEWLCTDNCDGPFSFRTVCETLGIEPQFLRNGLLQWREEQLNGVNRRRLARRSPVVRNGKISVRVRRRRQANQVRA